MKPLLVTGEIFCRNCTNILICDLPLRGTPGAHDCMDYRPRRYRSAEKRRRRVTVTEETSMPALLGLCVDCRRRADCPIPKPESGVWHCERYL